MTSYKVLVSKHAAKQLASLDKNTRARIKKSLRPLNGSGGGVRQLQRSKPPAYSRLRVGDYRIIFTVDEKSVIVTEIMHRKNAYELM